MNRMFKMSVAIVTIIIADQVVKKLVQQNFFLGETVPVIPGFFHLTYVRNPGAAFGMLAYSPDYIRTPLFFIIPVIACFWMLYLIWSTRKNEKFLQCLAYSLIFAGALGNLIDRFSRNYVVDMFDFFWRSHHFAVFNLADSAISVAAVLLIVVEMFFTKKKNHVANSI